MTIHYYSGVWVAGDGSQQTGFYFSTDGKSWSPAACSEKYVQVSEIFGSSGIYVAGISNGASYSIDGKTWYIVPFKDVPCIYNAMVFGLLGLARVFTTLLLGKFLLLLAQ